MTSVWTPASPRKRSKNDLRQIEQEQGKIGQMVHAFYERTRTKVAKALSKCETRNDLLCRQLFDALSLHPNQELYETIRLHDLLFNEIDLVAEAASEFIRRIDSLQERLKAELELQQELSTVKREKIGTNENSISVLRKVSFKRQKHALKHRSLTLDTVNKKILKCEASHHESKPNGFHIEIEGRKTQTLVLAYSKIWFESKRREYLLCQGSQQQHNKLFIFNDKMQTIATFPNPLLHVSTLAFLQLHNYVYLISTHQIARINLLNDVEIITKCFVKSILRAEVYEEGVALWVIDRERQHSILFVNEDLDVYNQTNLKLAVASIPAHFRLGDAVYFLTATYTGQTQILKLEEWEAVGAGVGVGDVGAVEEVISVGKYEEVILRLPGNRFKKFNESGLFGLEVEIEQGEAIRSCAVLGEHFYALSENGKSMLQCHYQPVSVNQPQT